LEKPAANNAAVQYGFVGEEADLVVPPLFWRAYGK
jgi:hypothetical protein